MGGRKKLTTESFIERAINVHGNTYDYSLVDYVSAHKKVTIICSEHGCFEQEPNDHTRGFGCRRCAKTEKYTTNEFIDKAKDIHSEKYDYSLVNYVTAKKGINIICKKHGNFVQTPYKHLCGQGCPKCADNINLTTEEFIRRAFMVHKNNYNYSLVDYVSAHKKVTIVCNLHGEFKQKPSSHLMGRGCPTCKQSVGEKKISKFLEKNKIMFESEKKFEGCKNKNHLLFDFYIPKQNILIEYDGKQHFKPIDFFGGVQGFTNQKNNDKLKNKFAKEKGIKLLRIPYYDIDNIDYLLSSELLS